MWKIQRDKIVWLKGEIVLYVLYCFGPCNGSDYVSVWNVVLLNQKEKLLNSCRVII